MGVGNPHGYPDYTWPMVWVLQDGELWPIEQWVAKQGVDKTWRASATLAGGTAQDIDIYIVPAGKAFYLVGIDMSGEQMGGIIVRHYSPDFIHLLIHIAGYVGDSFGVTPPKVIAAGKTIRVRFENHSAATGFYTCGVRGFEIDA